MACSGLHAAWLWLVPLFLVACSFDTSTRFFGAENDGAPGSIDASAIDGSQFPLPDADPSLPDADPTQPDANPDCLLWSTDFTSDPTLLDQNGDGQPDWVERNGNPFPTSELSGGLWTSPSFSAVLDTNPKHDFSGRTTLKGELRSTVVSTERGAVFWINVDYTSTDFAPLYVGVKRLVNDTQTLTLYGKTVLGIEVELATVPGLASGGIDLTLEVDTSTEQVTLIVDSQTIGSYTYTKVERLGNDDRFATAVAYGSEAQFNSLEIESCP